MDDRDMVEEVDEERGKEERDEEEMRAVEDDPRRSTARCRGRGIEKPEPEPGPRAASVLLMILEEGMVKVDRA